MGCKGVDIRAAGKAGAVEQDKLERALGGGAGDGWGFPAKGGEGTVGQERNEECSKVSIILPALEHLSVGNGGGVAMQGGFEDAVVVE